MAKWGQNKRLSALANQVSWKGDNLVEFADLIRRLIPRLNPRIAALVQDYYLNDTPVERREEDGKYDSAQYQKLYIGRDSLAAILSLTEDDLRLLLKVKEAGQ